MAQIWGKWPLPTEYKGPKSRRRATRRVSDSYCSIRNGTSIPKLWRQLVIRMRHSNAFAKITDSVDSRKWDFQCFKLLIKFKHDLKMFSEFAVLAQYTPFPTVLKMVFLNITWFRQPSLRVYLLKYSNNIRINAFFVTHVLWQNLWKHTYSILTPGYDSCLVDYLVFFLPRGNPKNW